MPRLTSQSVDDVAGMRYLQRLRDRDEFRQRELGVTREALRGLVQACRIERHNQVDAAAFRIIAYFAVVQQGHDGGMLTSELR
jgi:hypothetical protein